MRRKRVIIAGSGLAAITAALEIEETIEVWMVAPGNARLSNSYLAKGGVAFPLNPEDISAHFDDTLMAGGGLNDRKTVENILLASLNTRETMLRDGFVFDSELAREGGHMHNRIHHVGDETGKHLMQFYQALLEKRGNIRFVHQAVVLQLRVENGICNGVLIGYLDQSKAEWLHADAVLLATGGCAALYRHHTNNPMSMGEGYAIAYQAGAGISGMEFVQFHPTLGLTRHRHDRDYLVTEAFRGAGAILCDEEMNPLMDDIHELGSLAPRDIVSRTLFQHLQNSERSKVWLDFSDMDNKSLCTGFPALYQWCQHQGYLSEKRIQVTPAAHYMCGGVTTTLNGETDIRGLYAAGEIACTGLHGANRLASNSLLELLVVSRRAAHQINQLPYTGNEQVRLPVMCDTTNRESELESIQNRIAHIMWTHFGILRNRESMHKGFESLLMLESELKELQKPYRMHLGITQCMNRIKTALLIAQSACERDESIGCHFRTDFPFGETASTMHQLRSLRHSVENH